MFRTLATVLVFLVLPLAAKAQDTFWVQIEARQTLAQAQERARLYARQFDDVEGYYLGRGFYGIVLGPYSEALARQELSRLLATRQIPSDSYLQNGRRFEQQFWPIGGGAPRAAETPVEPIRPAVNPITAPQETLREARSSEAALTREDRQELQKALAWGGYYSAAIDGSFGRGTRASMESWQLDNLQQGTGVLTTSQRGLLLKQYNAVLSEVDMQMIRDDAAGIALEVPTAAVSFAQYQPPFAQYDATASIPGARLMLISQRGDAGKMRGLYEVMQTLEIIPFEGERAFRSNGFFIEGVDEDIHSFTTVSLQDGEIKGFTLVWPAGDENRRSRVIEVMRESFTRLDGVLDANLVPATDVQSIDMVSGLNIRRPRLSRTGFYASGTGHVVTTPDAIEDCDRITLDREQEAEIIISDAALGVSLLRPLEDLAPLDVATLQVELPRLQDPVAVAGYPFGGVLSAPTLTFGNVVDIRGLTGEETIKRLSVTSSVGDAGGPVLDASGTVLGMLLPRSNRNGQSLPADVQFSVKADQIATLLATQGIDPATSGPQPAISPVALTARAADITVLVSCW
ncbi:trypsin-like peptidase domain-containing protein [Loktanella sp. Alg231-35]|uniref:trypsin-like peptidase domain-containing protein n=1 Tax=Loktanella sp. Alg231-35 TaxID=1922220 RepID=UPI000D54CC2A|nr:trypsin-like peptidase domain-containing protein [Loktanella sp. Alg231-35]